MPDTDMQVPPASQHIGTDVRLVAHDWGGVGPLLLLSHPNGFHGKSWAPLAHRLQAIGYHPWSIDLRGHGDSDAPEAPTNYEWENFALDLLVLADHLQTEAGHRVPLVGIGHSLGGSALLLAEALAPGTFERLWIYEPPIFPPSLAALMPRDPGSENPMGAMARRRRNLWTSHEETIAVYRSKPPMDRLHPEALEAYVTHGLRVRDDGHFELKCRPEVEATIFEMSASSNIFEQLDRVLCPTRIVRGSETDPFMQMIQGEVAARLPHARLDVLDGLAHFGPLEDPARVATVIDAFCSE